MVTTSNDVTQAIALLDPAMQSITDQGSLFNATDRSDWTGIALAWSQEKDNWKTLTAWYQLPTTAAALADDAMGKVKNFRAQAAEYSAILSTLGGNPPILPNVDPVNPPSPPSGGPGWWASLGTWGKGAVVVVGGAVGLFVLDKVTDLAEVAGKFKK